MNDKLKGLVTKWEEILNEGSEIKRKKVKAATALMLENQDSYFNESSYSSGSFGSTTGATSGYFKQIAIPMVRRTFPELIAHDVVGVQPLTGPVGLAFALRYKASGTYAGVTDAELGYNYMDPSYSGAGSSTSGAGMATLTGEGLGSNVAPSATGGLGLGIGDGTPIKEVNMTVEKAQVEAKTRKLRSRWSVEVAQDLKAMHGLDLEEEMLDVLAYEITAEIDREIVDQINSVATSSGWNYSSSATGVGRWETEIYRTLYNKIIRKANEIAVNTRRGAGNFVISSPYVCAALECLSSFIIQPVPNDINTAVTGVSKIGSLDGRLAVYRDTFTTHSEGDYCTVGYKGPSEYDAGIIYLPYVQLMVAKAMFEDSLQPSVGLMSRYAVHSHIFGAENYYQYIRVHNLPS